MFDLEPTDLRNQVVASYNGKGIYAVYDDPDPGIPDWTIYLDQNQNGRRDPGEPFTVTDTNGDYAFTGLPPGTYRVAEEQRQGWTQTYPTESIVGPELIVNGSFEQGSSTTSYQTFDAGSKIAPGWDVIEDTVDVVYKDFFVPSTGNYSVDLTGTPGGGAIRQTVPTVPGQRYTLLFDLAGNPGGGSPIKHLRLQAGSHEFRYDFDTSSYTMKTLRFRQVRLEFTADSAETVLILDSLDSGFAGPVVDSVSVRAMGAAGYHTVVVNDKVTVSDVDFGNRQYVASQNLPPEISSAPPLLGSRDKVYRYNAIATDPNNDPLTFDLPLAPDGMTVHPDRAIVVWQPTREQAGTHQVVLRVQDGQGGVDLQSFTITVVPPNSPPVITSIPLSPAVANLPYVYQVSAQDADIGDTLTFRLQDPLTGMAIDSATGRFTWTPTTAQIGSRPVAIVASDGQPGSPDQIVTLPSPTYLTDVFGSVRPMAPAGITPAPLEYYAVQYARLDQISIPPLPTDYPDARFQTLVEVRAPAGGEVPPVGDQALTVNGSEHHPFDPTLLANDTYVIRVIAEDVNGHRWTDGIIVTVDANAKLGNFHLDFPDLTLPLAGIPITRSYDTLQANSEGDFGYGWTMGIQEANIRETVPAGVGNGLFSNAHPFVPESTRVYLTNPEGKRIGFTYYEELILAGMFTANFAPRFRPDPGVYDTLEAEGVITRGMMGWFDYNPDEYLLTTKDGLKYRYSQSDGLQSITDPNGTQLTFTKDAVTHSSGAKIDLIRDFRGRIKEIVAPDGTSVKYTYNAAGDLLSFTNQAGEVTTYGYLADPKHPHFLDTITDSRNVKVFQAEFDENGRLKGSTDALGNTVSQDFDPGNFTGTITDAKQNVTELLYNDRGNVLEKREPNPVDPAHPLVTKYEYTDPKQPDKETKITDRNGVVETRVYDAAGNMTQVKRAVGTPFETTTAYVYNARGDVTSIQQNGQTPTVFDYDSAGKLTGIVNAVGGVASATHDASGRQVSFTDFNGNATTYDYKDGCDCGSPKKITYADGTCEQFAYNGYGQVTQHDVFEADGTLVETSSTAYDRQGRTIEESQGAGASKTVVQKRYDGNLLDWEIIVNPASPNETPATPVAQRKSRITDYAYDAAGRLVTQTDAEGGVVQFRYDANGNRVLLQDPVGNVTTWVYDALNRMVEERDPFYGVDYVSAHAARFAGESGDLFLAEVVSANDDPSGAEHVRVYGYDGEGNQTKIIDRDQRRREFAYDPLSRLTEERWYDPDGTLVRTIVSTYDVIGNLKSIIDPDSTYTYRYLFTGREYVSNLAMYYYRARFFDPTVGSLTQMDPISFESGTTNLYAYADNSPVAKLDPFGTMSLEYAVLLNAAAAALGGLAGKLVKDYTFKLACRSYSWDLVYTVLQKFAANVFGALVTLTIAKNAAAAAVAGTAVADVSIVGLAMPFVLPFATAALVFTLTILPCIMYPLNDGITNDGDSSGAPGGGPGTAPPGFYYA